ISTMPSRPKRRRSRSACRPKTSARPTTRSWARENRDSREDDDKGASEGGHAPPERAGVGGAPRSRATNAPREKERTAIRGKMMTKGRAKADMRRRSERGLGGRRGAERRTPPEKKREP